MLTKTFTDRSCENILKSGKIKDISQPEIKAVYSLLFSSITPNGFVLNE